MYYPVEEEEGMWKWEYVPIIVRDRRIIRLSWVGIGSPTLIEIPIPILNDDYVFPSVYTRHLFIRDLHSLSILLDNRVDFHTIDKAPEPVHAREYVVLRKNVILIEL